MIARRRESGPAPAIQPPSGWFEPDTPTLRGRVSDAEWTARVELAALHRLVALQGWDDAIYTHLSMRAPGPEQHVLLTPFGALFEEVTASALIKVDLDGQPAQQTQNRVNGAGFIIHSAIHRAREDLACVMHMHTRHAVAVSSQKHGLLPLSQGAVMLIPRIGYHDYEGFAVDLEERERLARDLGAGDVLFLRNHGTLVCGQTAAEAWDLAYTLERACEQQILTLSAGLGQVVMAPVTAQQEVLALKPLRAPAMQMAWNAFLRRLDRRSPGYDR
jgi:ribulose-5-phosphate 4-epimerase/fuculose-1-phosphate aldolase